jgi:hypothetical protein
MNYFPTVYDTCYHFGNVKEDIVSNLSQSVPITSIVCMTKNNCFVKNYLF